MRNIKMAFRNMGRYKSRTILLGFMICFTTVLFMLGLSIGEGVSEGLVDRIRILNTGDVRITNKDNTDSRDDSFEDVEWSRQTIEDSDAIVKELTSMEGVKKIRSRIKFTGVVSAENKTGASVVVGIEANNEQDLLKSDLKTKEGAFLPEGENGKIYISTTAADAYDVTVGDKVNVFSQTAEDSSAFMEFTVCGIFEHTSWKEFYAYISLEDAKALVKFDGVTHILVDLDKTDALSFSKKIDDELGEKYKIKATTLKDASGLLLATVMVIDGAVAGMCVILFILTLVMLINNISMSFFERTKEIGILKALGESDASIMLTMILETLITCLIAVGIGEIISVLLVNCFAGEGIKVSIEALKLSFGTERFYPRLLMGNIVLTAVIPISLSLAVSVASLRKVMDLSPVNATKTTI